MKQNSSQAERLSRGRAESAGEGPRLLPWTSPDGNPCYLSTDGRGYLSALADDIETVQIGMGEELLEYARGVLAPGAPVRPAVEYRWLACRLTEALSDALRIADSRGQRIPAPQEATEDARPDEHN
nr:hypothetical protein OH826_18830 [Streptomyces sp. NBC_00899]